MDQLIVIAAKDLPYLVLLAAGLVWLLLDRPSKVQLAVRAAASFAIAMMLIKLAGVAHYDARPFVVDHSVKPLFPHDPDNGFPSDHTSLVFTVSLLVLGYRRRVGIGLLVASAIVAWARVASHVHHVQDVFAGALIGVIAVALGTLVGRELPGRSAKADA